MSNRIGVYDLRGYGLGVSSGAIIGAAGATALDKMGYSLRFNHVHGDNMLSNPSHQLLRYVLWADAISCLACGALQVAFAGSVSQHLGLPLTLLVVTGNFLLLYGAAVAFLAMRARAPTAIIWLLIVGNVAWGVAAVGVLLEGDVHPTLLGKGYILAQTLTVLILARLQYVCVRPGKAHFVGQTKMDGPNDSF